jgi:hypothetical protein
VTAFDATIHRLRKHQLRGLAVVDDHDVASMLRSIPHMSDRERDQSDDVLFQLQKAVEEQKAILARQGELILRLRTELKDVKK